MESPSEAMRKRYGINVIGVCPHDESNVTEPKSMVTRRLHPAYANYRMTPCS